MLAMEELDDIQAYDNAKKIDEEIIPFDLANPLQNFIKAQMEIGNLHSEQEAKAEILEALDELDTNKPITKNSERSKEDCIKTSEKRRDLSKWIGAAPGVFRTAQEVDTFIRRERDTWD